MDFSSPEKVSQTSITLTKVNPEHDSKRIRAEENKCIRINRKKLPSDFFRVSIEKKLKKKSSVDLCSHKNYNEIAFFEIKEPQTERKAHSYQYLSNSETNQATMINSERKAAFKVQDDQEKILQRKLLEKEPFETKSVEKTFRMEKSVDLTKLKPQKQKKSQEKIKNMDNFEGIIERKGIKHSTELIERDQTAEFGNFIDLGCTFGCGFNNKISFNVENCYVEQQNQLLNSPELVEEAINSNSPNKINYVSLEKSNESKELEGWKSKENSPIKEINKRKILKISEQSHQFDRSKPSSVQKNIINQDLKLFDNLCIEDTKIVFAATNEQKPFNLRKDKRNDSVNLPKIGKKASLNEKVKC